VSVQDLGEHARRRRHELGKSLIGLSRDGGPSHMTVLNIENGKNSHYRRDTLEKLDTVLDWPAGSAERLLMDGTPPSEVSDPGSVDDARALRIGRLMLALIDEMRLT
jgi:transcriptional regulator with XRE-family HTH domain